MSDPLSADLVAGLREQAKLMRKAGALGWSAVCTNCADELERITALWQAALSEVVRLSTELKATNGAMEALKATKTSDLLQCLFLAGQARTDK